MYTIKLRRQNHSVSLRRVVSPIRIRHTGSRGIPGLDGQDGVSIKGDKGDPGLGLPTGGAEGQVLVKASEQDYETQWRAFEGADKTYSTSFTVTNEVIVTHNMNKYPAVTVIDSAEEEVEGEVDYISPNQLVVRFVYPFSGRIVCN
jgi:hypothetical protein